MSRGKKNGSPPPIRLLFLLGVPAWSDLANILIWYQKPFQNRRFESLEPRFGGKKCTSKVKNHPFFMPFLM
jgi:hypothetical protein